MKTTRISTYLIWFSAILLITNFMMFFAVSFTVKSLTNDARLINQMGIVRGSIQRITKLALAGQLNTVSCSFLMGKIDHHLQMFLNAKNDDISYTNLNIESVKHVDSQWQHLKNLLKAYSKNKDDTLLQEIIDESETCWELADYAVLKAQKTTESKVTEMNSFYIFLSIVSLNTLIIIWIIYNFVRKNLEFRASHDSLTGLLNKHCFEKSVQNELERSKRYHHKFCLIVFDIDFFKKINDRYGHTAGDKVLISLARVVRNSLRQNDLVFRTGGEEFAVLVPEASLDDAIVIAEKIRKKVENGHLYKDIQITISLGVAESGENKSVSAIYHEADKALYQAKNTGRNRVVAFTRNDSPINGM